MSLTCPVCTGQSKFEYKFSDISLYRCMDCDHCFTDINSPMEFEKYEPQYFETKQNWFGNPLTDLYKKISSQITNYKENASVLDLGCGNGNFLKYLRKENSSLKLTGIDFYQNKPVEGINFINSDIYSWNFDCKYDVVVSLAVIEHVQDIKKFIKIIKALSVSRGLVVIMTNNEQCILYDCSKILKKVGYSAPFERLYSKHHINHFNISSLKRLVVDSGFSLTKTFFYDPPLTSIDFFAESRIYTLIQKIGVKITFLLGQLTGRSFLQTVFCKNENQVITYIK